MPHSTSHQPPSVRCDSEPTPVPGAIRPFGILLGIALSIFRIANASGNCAKVFGIGHQEVLQALLASSSLQHLCDQAVQQTRRMTGLDRVMTYRSTDAWRGDVVAEARAPHMGAFLHHGFPASDIPAQARAVCLKNWLRMIPDVGYVPVPLYPGTNPATGTPLDLFMSTPWAERVGHGIVAALDAALLMVRRQRSRIGQVLGNLISNALTFTPPGRRIAASLLSRIFDRVVQGDIATERGAGPGLASVGSIARPEGGRLRVDSAVGVGTTFSFTLPPA